MGSGRKSMSPVPYAGMLGKSFTSATPMSLTRDSLMNRARVMGYIELLRKRGMQADGQLTKLERLCDALAYAEKIGPKKRPSSQV